MGLKLKLGKKAMALIITGLVFAVIAVLHLFTPVFNYLEYQSYDMRVKFWSEFNGGSEIVISHEILLLTLDDESVAWAQEERGWGWPWPREAYAEIIDYFSNVRTASGMGVTSIAFDILYTEPSVYRHADQNRIIDEAIRALEESGEEAEREPSLSRGSETRDNRGAGVSGRQRYRTIIDSLQELKEGQDDAAFIEASRRSGNVIQVVMFSSDTGTADKWPDAEKPFFNPVGFGDFLERFNEGNNRVPLTLGQFPIPGLIESAAALGSATAMPDSDGIYRRLRPFTLFDGKAVPGLSTASLIVSGMGTEITYNEKSGIIQWEHISIPVDENGSALLKFKGSLDNYDPISLRYILDGTYDPATTFETYENLYVFVGVYGQGFFDIFPTPIDSLYPGVGAHITMLDNMLLNDFIYESSETLNLILLLIIVAVIVLLTMFSPRISISITGMVIVIIAITISCFRAYQYSNLWIPMVTFLAGTLISFITATLYNFATEGSQKRFIKSAFSQYLSPKVIEQIIQDPSQLKLGGEKREMTAIFTDVRGFSTFSEALGDPSKLVELLNFYLTKMSNIVLDNQGTIDKYEGDAIIAFFGAPIHYPNHASLACRAVINMKKAEPEINREAIETGLVTPAVMEAMFKKGLTKSLDDPCQIFTRIGMNTGDMVVGNMGTPNKMDYTIMGNAVNLAARLEGVNKQYNTGGILISEYTRSHIGDEFIIRPLSRVRVVGINTPLRLFELLDVASEAKPELLEMVKNWTQAFDLYEKQDFNGAGNIFESIYTKDPNDMAAKKYLDRCAKYKSAPPDSKTWDNGVDNLTEK